jgi:F-type H+-transporting ATPase subunit b
MPHIESIILAFVFAEGDAPWWDYPGLEAWKFVNLLVFIVAAVYFLKGPLVATFQARREAIRLELLRAKEAKEQTLARLAEVQARLSGLESEVGQIQKLANAESAGERERIVNETELEILKMRNQAQREIVSAEKAVRHGLRLFAAHESVRLAEDLIKHEIRPEDELRLVHLNVEQLGRG